MKKIIKKAVFPLPKITRFLHYVSVQKGRVGVAHFYIAYDSFKIALARFMMASAGYIDTDLACLLHSGASSLRTCFLYSLRLFYEPLSLDFKKCCRLLDTGLAKTTILRG